MNGQLSSVRKMQTVKHFLFQSGIKSLDCDLEILKLPKLKKKKKVNTPFACVSTCSAT